MTAFEDLMALLLLSIIPDPLVWAFLFTIVFIVGLAVGKTPGTVAAQFLFILIWVLNDYLAGPFNIFHMLMLAAVGVSLVLAAMKIGNR